MYLQAEEKGVMILIRWLHQRLADLDLHCWAIISHQLQFQLSDKIEKYLKIEGFLEN